MPPTAHCLNCEAELGGPFCARCGQRHQEPDRGLFEVVADLVSEAFEADGRLHRTAVPFFLRPGELTAEWMSGKRARFTAPPRIFIFALFVGFVGVSVAADRRVAATSTAAIEQTEEGVVKVGGDGASLSIDFDGFDATEFPTEREVIKAMADVMVDDGPKLVVALVPLLALLLKLVLWPHLALSHLVFSLNLHSRLLILGGLALLLPVAWPQVVVVAAMQVYLVVGLRRAYALEWRGAAWRYLVVALSYAAAWFLGVAALAVWAAVSSFA